MRSRQAAEATRQGSAASEEATRPSRVSSRRRRALATPGQPKGSPDSNKRDTTKSLTTIPVNGTRPRTGAGRIGSTEVGRPLLALARVRNRGNREGVFRLPVETRGEAALSPRRGGRISPMLGARQKNSWSTTALPFLIEPRCAAPPNPSRRQEMASLAAGHRQSRLPSTARHSFPKEDAPLGWSGPGSTSEEASPGANRKPRIRSDTAGPASRDRRF